MEYSEFETDLRTLLDLKQDVVMASFHNIISPNEVSSARIDAAISELSAGYARFVMKYENQGKCNHG